ncbi:MAG: AAA family ATPase [Candidatus Thorarchaeota archaeon]|jgi:hypothetical protein
MKSSTDYAMSSNFGLLLLGPPKHGKTNIALSFPDPVILDCDKNLAGAIRRIKETDPSFKFQYDDPNEVEPHLRWKFCMNFMNEAVKSDAKTIIIDGLSCIQTYLIDHIINSAGADASKLTIAGEKAMQMTYWTPFKNNLAKFIMAGRAADKLFIMTCHEETIENSSGGAVGYRPLISGQLKHHLAGYFSDCWRCEAASLSNKVSYKLRVAPKNLHQIGNSLGISEHEFEVTNQTPKQVWDTKLKQYFK